jgi:hypothetical protein
MTKCAALVVIVLIAAASATYAYGPSFYESALGTVVPAPATAQVSCYPMEAGYVLAAANTSRADILATFVKQDATGSTVCFLRTPPLVTSPTGGLNLPALSVTVECPGEHPACAFLPAGPYDRAWATKNFAGR